MDLFEDVEVRTPIMLGYAYLQSVETSVLTAEQGHIVQAVGGEHRDAEVAEPKNVGIGKAWVGGEEVNGLSEHVLGTGAA